MRILCSLSYYFSSSSLLWADLERLSLIVLISLAMALLLRRCILLRRRPRRPSLQVQELSPMSISV